MKAREYRPILLSRRVEAVTWLLAGILIMAWWLLWSRDAAFTDTAAALSAFAFLAAAGISLSNWMDRRSTIRIDEEGVYFQNGLRKVELAWEGIEEIRVFWAQAGSRRVQVRGSSAYFEFRTMARLRLNGGRRVRSGFEEGEDILKYLLEASGLELEKSSDGAVYYTREP